jgi:hypothetical protein
MVKHFQRVVLGVACAALSSGGAIAATNFNVVVTAGGVSTSLGFDDAESSFDSIDTEALEALFPGFDRESDAARADIDYRGLPLTVAYLENSASVRLSIRDLGVDQTFNGATRSDSLEELKDFLSKNGGVILTQVNQALAATTATDPVAGNPNSLLSTMVGESFSAGFADNPSTGMANAQGGSEVANEFGVDLRFGQYSLADKDVKTFSLPLSYTVRFDADPRRRLRFAMPINYSTTETARTYRAGFGVAYTHPVTDRWSLTPDVSWGVMGSEELGSAASIRGVGVTSRYDWLVGPGRLGMGNMVSLYQTVPLSLGDYEIDSDLSNSIVRNGLLYTWPVAARLELTVLVDDTRFGGDELYVQRSNEAGFSLATGNSGIELIDNYFKLGASYVKTDRDDVDGFRVNFGLTF